MNYRRWIVVGFVVALAVFSFYHLSTAGSDYTTLTTSDSGFFYGVAREINHQNGFIEEYELSHPPQGKPIPKNNQFQSLMLVTLYRGLHALDPSLGLMDVCKYFSPLFFALSVIGAFLAGREFGGDLAGCASALFFSTLIGTIYWTKIGAFDREITLVFFGTWLFYLVGKVFRSRDIGDIVKYSAIGGIFYGFFLSTWPGAPILGAVIVLTIILLILERSISGLGFTVTGAVLFLVGNTFSPFDISEFLGLFLVLVGLGKIAMDWESVEEIESSVVSGLRSNWKPIGGILSFVAVSTVVGVAIGGYEPTFWVNMFTERIPSFMGIAGGEGGASFPTYASEAQPLDPPTLGKYFNVLNGKLYGNSILTGITIVLVGVAISGIFINSKPGGLFAFSWLIVVAPMPLAQTRFIRLFWPMWPVLAGLGVGFLLKWGRDFTFSSFSTSDFLERLRHPILLAIVFLILVTPFIQNARVDTHTSETQPVPHGGSLPTSFYHSLMDCFNWIENNTPEDSIVTIPWSYGHFATGATRRHSVTDGAETVGWRGEWEDSEGIKPPDYIKYIAPDGEGKIIGLEGTPARENQVNGRRIDVERMITTGDENAFAFIVNTYRENYDIKMDYIVFNNSVMRRTTLRTQALGSTAEGMEQTQKVSRENLNFIFNFEQENIKYSFLGVPTTQENERLAGIVYYSMDSRQIVNYQLNPDFEEPKILWVLLSNKQGVPITQNLYIQGGGLGSLDKMAMINKALDGYPMPDYLKEVYRSPQGQAAVYKIIHENASNYS